MITINDVRELINRIKVDSAAYTDQESLYECGVLDSLKVIHLMLTIEKEYDTVLDQAALEMDDFESVERICSYLNRLEEEKNQ